MKEERADCVDPMARKGMEGLGEGEYTSEEEKNSREKGERI